MLDDSRGHSYHDSTKQHPWHLFWTRDQGLNSKSHWTLALEPLKLLRRQDPKWTSSVMEVSIL